MSEIEPIDLGNGMTWMPPGRETEDAMTLDRLELAADQRAVVTFRLYGVKGGCVDVLGSVEKTEDGFRIIPVDQSPSQ